MNVPAPHRANYEIAKIKRRQARSWIGRCWPKCEVARCLLFGSYRGKSGSRIQSAQRCYCVRNLYATIRATMLAKMSSAERDFRIIGRVERRAVDRPGLGLGPLWNRTTLPPVGVRALNSGAPPKPPISL